MCGDSFFNFHDQCQMIVITQNGDTVLMGGAWNSEVEVVVELVKAGANVDVQDNVCQ